MLRWYLWRTTELAAAVTQTVLFFYSLGVGQTCPYTKATLSYIKQMLSLVPENPFFLRLAVQAGWCTFG